MWLDTSTNLDGYVMGSLALLVALLTYGQRRLPASLLLLALGCVGIVYARPAVALGLHQPLAPPPAMSWADVWAGLYRAALPQLPVTLLNAVVSTAKLTEDLYPERPATVRQLSPLALNPEPNPNPKPQPQPQPQPLTPKPNPNPQQVRQLSVSIGLMDASSCWFGHFPSCHGCGGLAAQHLYGN
jgi:hypothetical protein